MLSVFDLEYFQDVWSIGKSSQVHTNEDKSVQKRLVLIYGVSI
jgi:hypothetical protein